MLIKALIGSLIALVVLFIALVWLVCDLMHISMLVPALVTAFFVLAAAAAFMYRRYKASNAAQGLERELAAQAKAQAKLVRPDLQVEVQGMQAEFDKAVLALKSAKLGPGGRNALYFLPWYTIIGPPGAGKSTALRSSGLQFPYTSGSGGAAVKGLGGTRNCDWWLTNEAVVLDTAGRWSTQEEDHDEWLSFLGLLKRYRPKKPLNGIIAAISVGDVVNAKDDEVESVALRMRERLDEVQNKLGVSIPVYVLFTKCDLVEGFLESFGDLSRTDRNQVWGFTIPLAQASSGVDKQFTEQYGALLDVLERRALAVMADERSVERRALIYAFPQQFAALRRNLEHFVKVMFQTNIYQNTPSLRGVYFTSGTQEGRPFNLLVNRLVEAIGIKRKPEQLDTAVDAKSYFVHDLFMNVIFQDRDIAAASQAELKRQRTRRLALTSALGVVSLALGLIPGYAWSLNKYQLARIDSALDEWEAPEHKAADTKQKLQQLEPLRERVATLIRYERDGAPISMRMGMYQLGRLIEPMRHYYASLLRRELVQPVVSKDLASLSDFGLRYASLPTNQRPTDEEQRGFYDLLKLHLVLTQPKPKGEPAAEQLAPWLQQQLTARFEKAAGGDEALKPAAAVNAELYVSFAQEFQELPFPRDSEVVKRVRDALNRVDLTQRAITRLIAMAGKDKPDIGLQQLVGVTEALQERRRVRAAFTLDGYKGVVRDALKPELLDQVGELWVLGHTESESDGDEQRKQQLAALRTAYFTQYIAEWLDYLNGLSTAGSSDYQSALRIVSELARTPSPLQLLFTNVRYNVKLPVPEQDPGTAVVATLTTSWKNSMNDAIKKFFGGGAPITEALPALTKSNPNAPGMAALSEASVGLALQDVYNFGAPAPAAEGAAPATLPLTEYLGQLNLVRNALQTYLDTPSESAQLRGTLYQARMQVNQLISRQPRQLEAFFNRMLKPPVDSANTSAVAVVTGEVNNKWCTEVVSEYSRTVAGHYPFDRDGHDLALADFINFYKPKQGKLWTTVDSQFGSVVSLQGDRYTFRRENGQDAGSIYSQSLPEFLARSRDIGLSFFPGGSEEPKVELEVKVHPSPSVAMTQFAIGGKTVEHYNGPEQWKPLVWPGENPSAGAALTIRGANGMHETIKQDGPWGLYRLLEAGSLRSEAGRTFTVAWKLQTHDVTLMVDIRVKRSESPFFGVPGRLGATLMHPVRGRNITPPKSIAGGQGCR
jgi:type VI secretion system protein ImpL